MCIAAPDGWCADWACVTLEPKVTFLQYMSEDHDEDTVYLKQTEILSNTAEVRGTVFTPGGFRRQILHRATVGLPFWERCGAL